MTQVENSLNGAKALAAVPSILQPRGVYCELHEHGDRLETGREAVVNKDRNTEFWKSHEECFSGVVNRNPIYLISAQLKTKFIC